MSQFTAIHRSEETSILFSIPIAAMPRLASLLPCPHHGYHQEGSLKSNLAGLAQALATVASTLAMSTAPLDNMVLAPALGSIPRLVAGPARAAPEAEASSSAVLAAGGDDITTGAQSRGQPLPGERPAARAHEHVCQ